MNRKNGLNISWLFIMAWRDSRRNRSRLILFISSIILGIAAMVAIYSLGAREIYVIGHHDCGMTGMGHEVILQQAREAGIDEMTLNTLAHAGIDLEGWLTGFDSPAAGVEASVKMIRNHPLLPKNVLVHGLLMHPDTGRLDVLADGNAQAALF